MKIGIVVAAYLPTAKHWQCLINRCLHSIVTQTRKPDNLVIVLNGSSQWEEQLTLQNVVGSIQSMLQPLKDQISVSILHHDKKIGCAAARNLGFEEIKNNIDYIGWLDVDDRYHPDKLNIQEQALQAYPDIDILGTSFYDCNTAMNGLIVPSNDPSETDTHEKIVSLLKTTNPICGASTLISVQTFESNGCFNEKNIPGEIWPEYEKKMWEDWDFWIRASAEGAQIAVLPQRLYYWWHEMSVSREF